MSQNLYGMGYTDPDNSGTYFVRDDDVFVPLEPVDSEDVIRQLNSFLRGEISAAETYRMAIDKIERDVDPNAVGVGLLRQMQEDHGRACQSLRERIRELGGAASDSSGAWGAWAKFTMGTSKLLGDIGALKALKEGEEHGLNDYQRGADFIDELSADLIRNQLIPAQQRHISMLDQLMKNIAAS